MMAIPAFGSACEGMTHGEIARTVSTWASMFQRCYSPLAQGYENYGGRGIYVCPEWQIFGKFVADMGPRPKNKTLDRVDCNGHYEPNNCRWATKYEQARNTRRNRKIVVGGEEMLLVDASRKFGIDQSTIFRRLERGLTPDEACDNAGCIKVKLCEKDIFEIRRRIIKGETDKSLSLLFGVSPQSINNIRHGHAWKNTIRSLESLENGGDE